MKIIELSFLIAVTSHTLLSETCKRLEVRASQFALCAPSNWYSEVDKYGLIFACSRPHGGCTEAIGGLPRPGIATFTFAFWPDTKFDLPEGDRGDLSLRVKRFVRSKPIIARDEVRPPSDWKDRSRILHIRTHWSISNTLRDYLVEDYYFVVVRGRLFVGWLSYWSSDGQAGKYIESALRMILSFEIPSTEWDRRIRLRH
jgi:hypothetical protein